MSDARRSVLAAVAAAGLLAAACGPKPVALERERQLLQGARAGQPGAAAAGDVGGATGDAGVQAGDGTGSSASGPSARPVAGAAGTAKQSTLGPAAGAGGASGESGPGIGSTQGVTDTAITIGIHAPLTLSGVNIEPIVKLKALSTAYWNSVNDAGGINGRKVNAIIADDGYDPGAALQACRNLISQKVFFISGTGGADQIVACGQYAVKQGYPYTSLGVSEAGLVGQPGYFAFTLTYDQQAPLQAKYIVHQLAGATKPVALIRFDSANVDGAHAKFVSAFKAFTGKGPAVDDAVDKNGNQQQLTAECLKMQQANVQIVSVLAAPTVFTDLANACQGQAYRPQYVGWANTDGCPVDPQALGTPALDGCLSFQTSHQPAQFKTKVGDQCRAAWAKYSQSGSGDFPSGGESTCAFFDVIRQGLANAGRALGRDSFQRALKALTYDNGLSNPIAFGGGQIGGHGVVITKANAQSRQEVETDSTWRTDF